MAAASVLKRSAQTSKRFSRLRVCVTVCNAASARLSNIQWQCAPLHCDDRWLPHSCLIVDIIVAIFVMFILFLLLTRMYVRSRPLFYDCQWLSFHRSYYCVQFNQRCMRECHQLKVRRGFVLA